MSNRSDNRCPHHPAKRGGEEEDGAGGGGSASAEDDGAGAGADDVDVRPCFSCTKHPPMDPGPACRGTGVSQSVSEKYKTWRT